MINVQKPGMLTTIQDSGRHGFQKFGVIASGPMDTLAYRVANILVRNDENDAVLEITLTGPTLHFEEDMLLAICGGDLSPAIDGIPIRMWRPVFITKGSQLTFGQCKCGLRSYLAIAGGFNIPVVMNSKSTYLRAEIGGYKGRALRKGDCLTVGTSRRITNSFCRTLDGEQTTYLFKEPGWSVSSNLIPPYGKSRPIRVIKGPQFHLFSELSRRHLVNSKFEVTTQSDRMGYRLNGPKLSLKKEAELISEAVSFGTIQVPPDGNPIVLMADRQTTGGYPKIGQVATIDLPLLAQAKPGDMLEFTIVTLEEAQNLFMKKEREIQQLKKGISLIIKEGEL